MTTDTVTVKHTWRQEGTIMLRDDVRIDDLQRNHYGIIQRKGAFCFGMDAVLLSGFAVVKKGEKVLGLDSESSDGKYFSELPAGTYYVAVEIDRKGDYIEARDEYTYSVEQYAFCLKK